MGCLGGVNGGEEEEKGSPEFPSKTTHTHTHTHMSTLQGARKERKEKKELTRRRRTAAPTSSSPEFSPEL